MLKLTSAGVFACLLGMSFCYSAIVPRLQLGASAPDFTLPGVDGKTYSLKDFAGSKVLVIVFTCNHCPASQAYEDRLKKIVDDYQAKGVALVAINPCDPKYVPFQYLEYSDLNDSLEEMKIRAAYKKFNFPYLHGGVGDQDVTMAYGCGWVPETYVFDAERKLRYSGQIDDNDQEEKVKVTVLRNALDDLLAGREIKVSEHPSVHIQCPTQWRDESYDRAKQWEQQLAAEPVSVQMADLDALKALRKNDTGKLRLVNFWSTDCGPCVAEFPEFVTINRMYRGRAFEFIAVAANDPDQKKEVLEFLQKKHASNKNLLLANADQNKSMAAFDPEWDAMLPYTMLIGTKGEVIQKINGPINPLELKRTILKCLKVIDQKK